MALIQRGSFEDFSVRIVEPTEDSLTRSSRSGRAFMQMEPDTERAVRSALSRFSTVREAREVTRAFQPVNLEYQVSAERRGLALKSLTLRKGFEGFLQKLFHRTNKVYIVAWCWDLSGSPIQVYPEANADPSSYVIPLQVGQAYQFIGRGLLLFPARAVVGGLAVRIMLYESDKNSVNVGKIMSFVADTIYTSELQLLLTLLKANPTPIVLELIAQAAKTLAGTIGRILQNEGDDYVDFFAGYYPASEPWTPGEETIAGTASEITLTRFT